MKLPELKAAEEILLRLQKRGHVLKDKHGNTGPVMELSELFDIIHDACREARESF